MSWLDEKVFDATDLNNYYLHEFTQDKNAKGTVFYKLWFKTLAGDDKSFNFYADKDGIPYNARVLNQIIAKIKSSGEIIETNKKHIILKATNNKKALVALRFGEQKNNPEFEDIVEVKAPVDGGVVANSDNSEKDNNIDKEKLPF